MPDKKYKIFKKEDGVLVTKTLYVNPNQININWYAYDGKDVDSDYDGDELRCYLFEVIGIDKDKYLPVSVEYPKMAYADN